MENLLISQNFLKNAFGSWFLPLKNILNEKNFQNAFLRYENTSKLKPSKDRLFDAFKKCPYENLSLVILGQDPYFSTQNGKNLANGMAFSVDNGFTPPPSLKNILKNLEFNFNFLPTKTDFTPIAAQGVLFLNANLCVQNKALDCIDFGFLDFSDKVIEHIDKNIDGVVFLLWGNFAKKKAKFIKNSHILSCSHPSPLSVNRVKDDDNFLKQKHFLKANEILKSYNKSPINWEILR